MPGARPPAGYEPGAYPPFAVTVDLVVLVVVDREVRVLVVERGSDPYAGYWALPGGFVEPDEDLEQAAVRELAEETGVRHPPLLAQVGAYGAPGRDPRMRVVSVAYTSLLREPPDAVAGSDAARVELVPVAGLLTDPPARPLAFDHRQILADGLAAARPWLPADGIDPP